MREDILRDIYASIYEPQRWDKLLQTISAQTGSTSAAIQTPYNFGAEGYSYFRFHNVDEAKAQALGPVYEPLDDVSVPLLKFVGGDLTRVAHLHAAVSSDHLKRSVYCNEYLNGFDMGDIISLVLGRASPFPPSVLTLTKRHDGSSYSAEQVNELQRLSNPLRLATELRLKVHSSLPNEGKKHPFDALPVPVVLLFRGPQQIIPNDPALSLAHSGHVTLSPQTIGSLHLSEDRKIAQAIRRCVEDRTGTISGTLVVNGLFGERLSIRIIPLEPENPFVDTTRRPSHAVYLLPMSVSALQKQSEFLKLVFGTTPRETDLLLALLGDECPEDYATKKQLSIHTVRSQIQSLLRKCRVRSVRELCALARMIMPNS